MMTKLESIWIGYCPGQNISNIIENISQIGSFRYILISCIDSSREVASLPDIRKVIDRHRTFATYWGKNVIIDTEGINEIMHDHKLFTGFDEVWFLNKKPLESLPVNVCITSEIPIIEINEPSDIEDLSTLAAWMERNNCLLGIGDGAGLNYITTEVTAAQLIESWS
jgi:hypothetical protein